MCVAGPKNTIYLLEYDQRFKAYSGFIFYDYQKPLNVKLAKHSIDVCVVDPPFLARECLQKVGQTIAYLCRPSPEVLPVPFMAGMTVLCSGAVLEPIVAACMGGVRRTTFEPKHKAERLQNQFRCYVNFVSKFLPFGTPASAAATASVSASATSATSASASASTAASASAAAPASDAKSAPAASASPSPALAAAIAALSTAPVPRSKGRRFVIGGAPGSGKGTQVTAISHPPPPPPPPLICKCYSFFRPNNGVIN